MAEPKQSAELKQSVGYWTALAISIGAVAGTTLFFGASIGAQYSGNLLLVASVILGIIAVYIAACFGELVAMFPKAGGAYEFSKHTYGRFISFIVGWVAWLVGNISAVVLIVGAVNAVLPSAESPVRIGLSMGIILLLNAIAYIGIEAGSIVLIALSVVTIGVVAAVVAGGLPEVRLEHFSPFSSHPFASIFVTLFFLIEAFFGWESATYLAEETKNPRRTIPRAIVHATLGVAVLSTLAVIVVLGVFPWYEAAELTNPLSEVAALAFGKVGSTIVNLGIFLALIGAAAGAMITMPRLILSLARDKLFLGQFKDIHPRFNTPYKAVLFQTAALTIIFFMGFGSYQTLLSLLVPLALIMYIFLIGTVPLLRRWQPQLERPFKVPFGSVGPLIIVLMFLTMIVMWWITVPGAGTLLRLSLSLIGLGLPLYLLVELYYDPKAITEFNDIFALVTLITEKFTFSNEITESIFSYIGNVRGKTLLEFGCGVGTLTLPLLRAVGPHGKIYATHFSKNHIKITRKRAERAEWEIEDRVYGEIVTLQDPEHFRRVHPDIEYVDAVVSVGMLGYIQDMKNVLQELRKILPIGGKVCFVEYSDFFHLLPNVEWLGSDRMIEKMFREAGFSVKVVRKKSLLWDRIFLYGIKFSGDVAFI